MTATLATGSSDVAEQKFYRFRSVEALIGKHAELRNSEIFFSSPGDLNDPLEGLKDICWDGDAIAWRNLIRHYLLCLMQTMTISILSEPEHDAVASHDFTFQTEATLASDAERQLYRDICRHAFAHKEFDGLPELLASRGKIRRDELLYHLRWLHGIAFDVILRVFRANRLLPDAASKDYPDFPSKRAELFESLQRLDREAGDYDKLTRALFTVFSNSFEQMQLRRAIELPDEPRGRLAVLLDFPAAHIERLGALMHNGWFTACFTDTYHQAAMWGNYSDSHKGICLEFSVNRADGGAANLPLYRITGWGGGKDDVKPSYGYTSHEFHPVRYATTFPEIEFFSSLGRLSRDVLMSVWYRGENGEISASAKDILSESDEWRAEYWRLHLESLTTKLTDWTHEGEHRLILSSSLTDFSAPKDRKLRYKFENLSGIIFGIRTPAHAKAEVIRIIKELCVADGRGNFDFYQAYFSHISGKIERAKLSLI